MVAGTNQIPAKAYKPGSVTVAEALQAAHDAQAAKDFVDELSGMTKYVPSEGLVRVLSYEMIAGVDWRLIPEKAPSALMRAMSAVVRDHELQIMTEALNRVLLDAQARMQAAGVQLVRREDG